MERDTASCIASCTGFRKDSDKYAVEIRNFFSVRIYNSHMRSRRRPATGFLRSNQCCKRPDHSVSAKPTNSVAHVQSAPLMGMVPIYIFLSLRRAERRAPRASDWRATTFQLGYCDASTWNLNQVERSRVFDSGFSVEGSGGIYRTKWEYLPKQRQRWPHSPRQTWHGVWG